MQLVENLFSLRGRVAVVVGGAGQIGRETCRILLDAGCRVAVMDVPGEHIDAFVSDCNASLPDMAMGLPADITSEHAVEESRQRVMDRWGRVDILINHAHYKGGSRQLKPHDPFFAPFEDYPLEIWNETLRVNLTGLFVCCQKFGKEMLKAGSGSIINTSSTYGIVSPNHKIYGNSGINSPIAYATTKAAIINFTRYIATHWADRGVRANVLSPGGVANPAQSANFVENYAERTPLARLAKAHEYQGAILFLASDASSYMTGANLVVDGGWTAW